MTPGLRGWCAWPEPFGRLGLGCQGGGPGHWKKSIKSLLGGRVQTCFVPGLQREGWKTLLVLDEDVAGPNMFCTRTPSLQRGEWKPLLGASVGRARSGVSIDLSTLFDWVPPAIQKWSSIPTFAVWPCGSVGWCSKGCTRIFTIYGVTRGLVGCPAARWDCVPESCTRSPTLAGWCFRCSAGARWGGVPKVGVVFQKVVPVSPLCILLLVSTNNLTLCILLNFNDGLRLKVD